MGEFRARLVALRTEAGEPSYRALERSAARLPGRSLARQTIGDLLKKRTRPYWSTVETFVLACQEFARSRRIRLPDHSVDVAQWRAAFEAARRVRAHAVDPVPVDDGGPLREPYRPADSADTPVRMLRAEYAVVPFQARDELTVLLDWCQQIPGGDHTGLAVIHGVGGCGKTRLALEIAHRLRAQGWYGGVLPKGCAAALTTIPTPVVVVIDYADGRVRDTVGLMRSLRARAIPAVVLLTARAPDGQWLTDVLAALDDDRHLYRREEIALPDRHPDAADLYLHTVTALGGDGPVPVELPTPGARWTTLDLVLLGWIAATGAVSLPTTRPALYDEVLRHEENYWCTVYADLSPGATPERALLRRAAAVVSLVAPPERDVDKILTAIADLSGDPRERRIVRRTLWTCLGPAPGEGLAIRPDPIGDHLLLREFTADDQLLHATIAAAPDCVETVIATVDRAGQDTNLECATALLTAILEADPRRWRATLAVATQQRGPAQLALEILAARTDKPIAAGRTLCGDPAVPTGVT